METINLVYIDDTPDIDLSRYLDNLHQYYTSNGFAFEYYEIPFDNQKDYSSLLKDMRVQTANIIIIDSRLFENKTATGGGSLVVKSLSLCFRSSTHILRS